MILNKLWKKIKYYVPRWRAHLGRIDFYIVMIDSKLCAIQKDIELLKKEITKD